MNPARIGTPNRWLALSVLALAQLMDVLDNTIVNIALPSAQHDLGFTVADRQWVVTGYALAFGSLLLIGGRFCDLFGRKQMFLIGVAGFALASAVGGAATGFAMLLAARIAQGVFAAMLAPAALSLLSVTFADNPRERGRAFGIFGAVSGTGGALGLLLGGVFTETLSWRWCLYVNIVFALVAFGGAIVVLRNGERPERVRFDAAGALTAVGGLAGIVYGLGNAATEGWANPATWGPVIGGAVLLTLFVHLERRVAHPLVPMPVIIDRIRGTAYLTLAICGTAMFAIFLFLTYYLQQNLRLGPIQSGLAFLPMVGSVVVGAALGGTILTPRVGPRGPVAAGCILGAAGLALLTRIGQTSSYATAVLPPLLVMGVGFGLIFAYVQNAATAGVDPGAAGVASAMVNTAQQIGGSVGTATFSSLAALAGTAYLTGHAATATEPATIDGAAIAGYRLAFWIAAAIFVVAAVVAAALFGTAPLLAHRESDAAPVDVDPHPRRRR